MAAVTIKREEVIREIQVLYSLRRRPTRKVDQPIGFGIRQRSQQHSVHDAENSGACPETQCQRKHGHKREARILQERPQASAKDLEEYERLLAERFTEDPDLPQSPAVAQAATKRQKRLEQLYKKLFGS